MRIKIYNIIKILLRSIVRPRFRVIRLSLRILIILTKSII